MGSRGSAYTERRNSLHVVIISVPCPGHIIPSTELAKYLLALGMKVTCLSSGKNYPRVDDNLEGKLGDLRIRFQPMIKDVEFVSPDRDLVNSVAWMQGPSDEDMTVRLEKIVEKLMPPPACIISDLLHGWSQDVANKFRIPRHVLYTMPANALLYMLAGIPSLVSPQVAPKYPPGIWTAMVETTHPFHDYMTRNARRLPEASMILVNTFEDLEGGLLEIMRTEVIGKPTVKLQKILSIGPMIANSDLGIESTNSVSSSANQEVESCTEIMHWLDGQMQSSVLYVSFGSLLALSATQTHELALGLEVLGRPFLWVCRPPEIPHVIATDATDKFRFHGLPPGFLERIKGRGKLIHGWAPQQKILSHMSVGGFMSHCGWNSTLEALWSGKPLVAWPIAVEQKLTTRFLVDVMHLAVEVHKNADGIVESAEVVRAVTQLMEDEEENGIRTRSAKMQELAQTPLRGEGSSKENLEIFVECVKHHSGQKLKDYIDGRHLWPLVLRILPLRLIWQGSCSLFRYCALHAEFHHDNHESERVFVADPSLIPRHVLLCIHE